MTFLNETLHPKATSLVNHLINCVVRRHRNDPDFYYPLNCWKDANDLSDEKAADLYARVEEAFPLGNFLEVDRALRLSAVSKAMWANDKAVLA